MTRGKEIVKVASLARMELTAQERERFGAELEKITAYFAELQKLELAGEMILPYPCPRIPDDPREYDIKVAELCKYLKEGQFHVPPWLA